MKVKKTRPAIVNESSNNVANRIGTIAMARTSKPNSATSQFFINLRNNPTLNQKGNKPGFTVFGKVVDGLPLLKKLANNKTTKQGLHKHVPVEEIKIISVKLIVTPQLKEVVRENAELANDTTGEKFTEGVHYVRLKDPLPLLTATKLNTAQVEVIGAFSFGCGHCYGIYPLTQEWKGAKNKTVNFSYFHAVWNKAMHLYARTYYTAIEMQVEKRMHLPLFEAIVINQQKLSNRDELADFFASFGVERAKFVEIFDSDKVKKRVEQAENLTKKFNLASVPEFIVAGKYRVDPMRAGGPDEIFDVIDFLIKRESM